MKTILLAAEGKLKPCIITTSDLKKGAPTGCKVHTLRAQDHPTWAARRNALEQLLLNLK